MNTMTAEDAAVLAVRIRERQWGWKRAFAAWYLINGGSPNIIIEDGGVRTLERDATEFIKTNTDWLQSHGLADMVRSDGTLQLDTAGEYLYRPLGDLPDGFTAYQRITDT
jgi:hypothetical protein